MDDLCLQCHNVRGLQSADGAGFSGTTTLEIPRHPQKEIFEGVQNAANDPLRGVEFAGFSYGDGTHSGTVNIPDACTGCHFFEVTDADVNDFPDKATTGHGFTPRLETCLSSLSPGGCHADSDFLLEDGSSFSYSDTTIGAFDFSSILVSGPAYPLLYSDNDYDGDGVEEAFQDEIQGMLENLKAGVESQPGYDSEMFDLDQGLFDMELMQAVSDTARAAAYNYDYIRGDSSLGYHNPLYVINLLAASISVLP